MSPFVGDSGPEFEQVDNKGSTLQFDGTVDDVGISLPNPAQTSISEFLIQCPDDQDIDYRLLVSIDGVNFLTLQPSGHWAWTPKGRTVTQLTIKSNDPGGNVKYELVMNLEAD